MAAQTPLTAQTLTALQIALAGANPIALLLAAEAGGVGAATAPGLPVGPPIMAPGAGEAGAPPSGASALLQWYGGAFAVAAALNFSMLNYNRSDLDSICAAIAAYMQSIAYLTSGATPAVPNGNTYNYAFT